MQGKEQTVEAWALDSQLAAVDRHCRDEQAPFRSTCCDPSRRAHEPPSSVAIRITMLAAVFLAPANAQAVDPLASWNDGAAKAAIVEFRRGGHRRRARRPTSPPAERIAVFDNDGTLWAEQPLYFQFVFMLDQLKAGGAEASGMEGQPGVQGAGRARPRGAGEMGQKPLLELLAAANSGMTVDEYRQDHPRLAGHARAIRSSSGPTPSSSTSRCWSCSPTCAPTASRPSSSPAAASSSCGPGPRKPTAFRPSRSIGSQQCR